MYFQGFETGRFQRGVKLVCSTCAPSAPYRDHEVAEVVEHPAPHHRQLLLHEHTADERAATRARQHVRTIRAMQNVKRADDDWKNARRRVRGRLRNGVSIDVLMERANVPTETGALEI